MVDKKIKQSYNKVKVKIEFSKLERQKKEYLISEFEKHTNGLHGGISEDVKVHKLLHKVIDEKF